MKKCIYALLMSAALAAGITGCSGDNGSSGAQPQESGSGSSVPTAEAEQPEEKKNAKVTIEGTKFMVDGQELWLNGEYSLAELERLLRQHGRSRMGIHLCAAPAG